MLLRTAFHQKRQFSVVHKEKMLVLICEYKLSNDVTFISVSIVLTLSQTYTIISLHPSYDYYESYR